MKINANFFTHHKARRLQKTRGNDGIVSLVKLWGYAEQFREDGFLSNMKGADIELVADWNGDEGLFVYSLVDIGFLDENNGTFSLHDWADWSEENPPLVGEVPRRGGEVPPSQSASLPALVKKPSDSHELKFGSLLAPVGEPFPPHEECDYQVELESCNDSDDYAALIRKGIEVVPVDLFGTGKSADELRKESMGTHYDDYNAMMARTRGNTG